MLNNGGVHPWKGLNNDNNNLCSFLGPHREEEGAMTPLAHRAVSAEVDTVHVGRSFMRIPQQIKLLQHLLRKGTRREGTERNSEAWCGPNSCRPRTLTLKNFDKRSPANLRFVDEQHISV